MSDVKKTKLFYRGKQIDKLTKTQLINALENMYDFYEARIAHLTDLAKKIFLRR